MSKDPDAVSQFLKVVTKYWDKVDSLEEDNNKLRIELDILTSKVNSFE